MNDETMNSKKWSCLTRGDSLSILMCLLALLAAGGCASLRPSRSFVDVAQPDLERVMRKTSPYLVHVTVKQVIPERIRRVGSLVFKSPGSTRTQNYTGVVVAEGDHVLVPLKLEKDNMQGLSVWIGEDECKAEFIAYDKELGVSIIQVKTDKRLPVLPLTPRPELPKGQWLAVLSTAGEGDYFIPQTGLFMICGRRPTRYPELVIDGIGPANSGAPLLNRDGQAVGIVKSRNTAIALSNVFCHDLSAFIGKSLSDTSANDKEKKGRFGVGLQPITKDLAKYWDVPASALWVSYVLPGSAGEEAGLKNGDLITAFDGQPLLYSGSRTENDLNWRMEAKKFKPFTLTVWRDGKTHVCQCKRKVYKEPVEFQTKELGLVVREIDEYLYSRKNLTVRKGVLVTQVIAGSPASTSSTFGRSLIRPNDVIVEVSGVVTPDVSTFRKAVEDVRTSDSNAVLIKYKRGRLFGYAGLNLNVGSISNGDAQ